METRFFLLAWLVLLGLGSCNVHEYPDVSSKTAFCLRLGYQTDFSQQEHLYETRATKGVCEAGEIRYVVRAYPLRGGEVDWEHYTEEFVFTKDVVNGYNHEVVLELESGAYQIMVWSDLVENVGLEHSIYGIDNFSEIVLQGEHRANTDYKDAFRGVGQITLEASAIEVLPDTLDVAMERPLAKFEFVTNDLKEFIIKEMEALSKAESAGDGVKPVTKVDVNDYKVVFYYVGFMPHAYSMFTDKPVDSKTGVMFESKLTQLNETEASLGFDYVFVNGKESAVTIQVGIFNKDGKQLSLTDPIEVPLKRAVHTIMVGKFLMAKASGGVVINPDYEGDHNIVFP